MLSAERRKIRIQRENWDDVGPRIVAWPPAATMSKVRAFKQGFEIRSVSLRVSCMTGMHSRGLDSALIRAAAG